MTAQHDNAKRWQFNLRELIFFAVLVSMTAAIYRIASLNRGGWLLLDTTAAATIGGLVGGLFAWALDGTQSSFLNGYVLGAVLTPILSAMILGYVEISFG